MAYQGDVVADFYTALHAHDWDRLAATMSDDVVRIGVRDNEADTCRGKDRYVEYVKSVIGRFERHAMQVQRIIYSPDGKFATAETLETIQPPGGGPIYLHNLKLIVIDDAGLIKRFDQFWKIPPTMPPDWITVEAVEADSQS